MSSLIVEVCKIDNVQKHPNADKLDVATIKGWNCIVGRNEYTPGDLVVFIPPDSLIPDSLIEERKLDYLKNGNRIRAVKLRGIVSQGLILSIPTGSKWKEGQDVAKELGITKWEPPVKQIQGASKTGRRRSNPNFYKYTDIENVRNYNDIFKDGDDVIITEKIHGSNWRAGNLRRGTRGFWNWLLGRLFGEFEFVYGSHNVQLDAFKARRSFYKGNPYGQIVEKYRIKDVVPPGYTVYGEIYGKGIQDLTYGFEEVELAVFDVMKDGEYLSWPEMKDFCKARSLPTVPVLFVGQFSQDVLAAHTRGYSRLCPSQIREGCVVRSISEDRHMKIGRKILKSISEDYLTRKGEATEYK